MSALVDSLASGALSTPEALVALADTAFKIATAADPGATLREALGSLLDVPAISGAIDEAVSGALDLLSAEFGPVVSGAVEALLADPNLVELADSVIGFFSEPGVAAALAGAAGEFATAVLTGADIGEAVTAAWGSLQADPAIQAVADLAVTDLVGGLLDDATALQLLGDTVTQLVTGLVDDAALGELAGSVLTGFIGSPGVPAALAGVAGEFATALLSGADLGDAALVFGRIDRLAERSCNRGSNTASTSVRWA